MKNFAKLAMVTVVSLIIGTASVTLAEDVAKNVDTPEKICPCPNQKGMGKFQAGMGMFRGNEALSEEQIEKIKALRAEFQDTTRDLSQELQSKKFALKSELAKKESNAKTAKALQKDISALNAELGQKRIEHLLEMKKIAPYGGMMQMRGNRAKPGMGRFKRM